VSTLPDTYEVHRVLEVAAAFGGSWPYIEDLGPDGEIVAVFDVSDGLAAGGKLDPFVGVAWDENLHPDDRQYYAQCREAMRRTGPFSAEYRMISVAGETVWVREDGAAESRDDGWVRFYGVLREVSEEAETRGVVRRIGATIHEYYFVDELFPDGATGRCSRPTRCTRCLAAFPITTPAAVHGQVLSTPTTRRCIRPWWAGSAQRPRTGSARLPVSPVRKPTARSAGLAAASHRLPLHLVHERDRLYPDRRDATLALGQAADADRIRRLGDHRSARRGTRRQHP
jgi:hypothetical protein